MKFETRNIFILAGVIIASVIIGMFAGSWLITRHQPISNVHSTQKLTPGISVHDETDDSIRQSTNEPSAEATSVQSSPGKALDGTVTSPTEFSFDSDSALVNRDSQVESVEQKKNTLMAQAETAYSESDYTRVLQTLTPLGEAGDGLAQYRLGLMYVNGLGVPPDIDKAIYWLERALESDMPDARELLLEQYKQKIKTASSMSEKVQWYERAAKLHDIDALAILGSYYLSGTGVKADTEKALDLLTAAAASDFRAMSNLGYMYSTGTGVEKNDVIAHAWYTKAANLGLTRAQTALANQYEQGRGVEKNMPEAVRWYLNAASAGDKQATIRVGSLIAAGAIQPPTVDEGVAAVGMAATAGDMRAVEWMESRSEEGNSTAQGALADILFAGSIVERDELSALSLLKSAAEGNHRGSQFALAERYTTGSLVELDYVMAHKWANLSSISGYPGASELRDTLDQLMTPQQITQAQQLARDWLANNSEVLIGDSIGTPVVNRSISSDQFVPGIYK